MRSTAPTCSIRKPNAVFGDWVGRRTGVLMVAYTLRRSGDAETIRLISARRASGRERAAYQAKD
jgi:uncharacterized DUF497 family protein